MRNRLFPLFLLLAPAFAQAGDLALSPSSTSVANGQVSTEIVLTYTPGASATAMEAELSINLDRHGWAQTQVVPAAAPVQAWCQVTNGRARAIVMALDGGNLPAGVPIAVCRVRVRTHAHTSRGFSNLAIVDAQEVDAAQNLQFVTTHNALIYVPW